MLVLQVFLISLVSYGLGSDVPTKKTHDFHYSRMELNWNASTSTWQVVARAFTDDLEHALQADNSTNLTLNLGDQLEHDSCDAWIAAYITKHCISSTVTSSNEAVAWNYIGKDVEFDLTYLYFESQPLARHDQLELATSFFFDLFDDQVNEVTFQAGEISLREWLTFEAPKTKFQWEP
tara:strand:+ start:159 stop:692 length:534 start_codon:yes stop_codon:yes gene_type:complete